VEGTALTALLVSGPAHGTLTLNGNGSFTYTPDADYNGPDSFTYKVNDGQSDSNVATVSLTVSAVNDAPTADADAYAVDEDQSLTIAAPGVLGNDGDVDGDPLGAVLVSGPAHGTVNLHADGSFTYTPNANYHGSDSFTYKANDGQSDSNVATVAITVNPVNDAPLVDAGPDQTVNEGSTVAFNSTASDADGGTLSYLWDFGDGATATGASPTHAYADNGTYTVTLTVNDGQGGVSSDSLVVTVLNVTPTLTLSGASAVNEGSAYTLNLAASDPGQDTIANWTIAWGDGSVQTVAGNPGSVSHTYADGAQSYTITATASDEDGTYNAGNSLNVTVNNVAPTASMTGPATGARGQVRTFALAAADPSATDQGGSFTFNINWGDGSSQASTGPASQQVGHTYTAAGTYTVQVTATDKDGAVSTTVQQTITVKAVDVQEGTLVIGGTTADDNISVAPADASGNLAVTINGASQGTFSAPAQIVVYGQSGNDQIKLTSKKFGPTTYYVAVPAALFGDAGNDTLDARGSTANNILVGGAGTDTLQGGSGRDLLIGGVAGDTLHGNGGDDMIIGNSTDYDANLNALNALMAEWARTDADYTTRVNHLNGSAGGGLNGGYFLNNATVHDDVALDQLYGEAGGDWFFYAALGSNKDRLNDWVTGEVATAQ
jgi:VCBS repeat-containing protein